MNNPFFGAMGGGNGFMQMVQQFQQFKANFHGDPKAEVEKLLQSGKLSQAQLNQLQQMAKQWWAVRWLLCREHHAAERLCRCQPKHEQRFPDR